MRAMTGSRLAGILSTMAVFLLPALGVGVASALDVGEVVQLLVPDVSEFPEDPVEMDFHCVAITDNAYWLVQDITYLGSNPASPDTDLVWQNIITQAEIDSLTAQFEGDGVDVYGTVTSLFGPVPDTDADPRIWIVFADMPDFFQNQSGPSTRVGRYVEIVPADIDGSGTFNNHDIIYVNAGVLESQPVTASKLRTWYIPSGLAMLIRTGVRTDEDLWVTRGLGQIAQYECYGLTYAAFGPNKFGVLGNIQNFETSAMIELSNWRSGLKQNDFARNLGQEFLWFMYLRQRVADDVCYDIAQADTIGMYAVGRGIDPSVADSLLFDEVVSPLYMDWMVTNTVNHLRSDFAGGIYMYDYSEGETYQFSHNSKAASYVNIFNSYPFGNWIADVAVGMAAPIWAGQYVKFLPDYSAATEVLFNGQFGDGVGSGPSVNAEWDAIIVHTDDTDILAVAEVTLDDLYNGTFPLAGGGTNYLVVSNNNEGGAAGLRYVLTQDSEPAQVLIAFFQNLVNPQYTDVFSSLYDGTTMEPEGYDWYGPMVDVTHFEGGVADSTAHLYMYAFVETLWDMRFSAWDTGNFEMTIAGYDSAGLPAEAMRELAIGYVESNGLVLEVSDARIDIPAGSMSPGQGVMIAQTDVLGLSIQSQLPVSAVEPAMSGILEGPVSVSDVQGTISFPADTQRGSVYRWSGTAWTRLDSYWQSGRMFAPVADGGIYVYGTAPGVVSPELPASLTLAGNSPNPFSAETVISFSLPTAGRAVVRVYDMTGRVIRNLAEGEMAAASHSMVWDGRDDSGNPVGAGVYFCRLEASGQSAVQKMLRVSE